MAQPNDDHMVADSSTNLIAKTRSYRTPQKARIIAGSVLGIAVAAWAASASYVVVLMIPAFMAPTIYFFHYNSRLPQAQQVNSNRLFWNWVGTAFPGMPLSMLLQGALLIPFVALVFGSRQDFFWHEFENVHKESDIRDDAHRAARAAFTATPAYWVFTVFLSYIDAAAIEELLKYAVIMISKRKQENLRNLDYIMYGAASGLSFATFEGLGFVMPECQRGESAGKILMIFLERMCLGIPLHVICGILTAVNLARVQLNGEKLGFLRVVGPAVFFHGSMNVVLLGYCAWTGIVGWIHPEDIGTLLLLVSGVLIVIVAAAFTLRRSMAKLESQVVL